MMCRDCGYDLRGSDLTIAAHQCPECGQVNIPFDPRAAPITDPSLPSPVRLAGAMLWPGLSFAACMLLAFAAPPFRGLAVMLVPILLLACLAWPPGYADLLAGTRVPKVRRGRWVAAVGAIGMLANLATAVVLGMGGVVVGARLGRW